MEPKEIQCVEREKKSIPQPTNRHQLIVIMIGVQVNLINWLTKMVGVMSVNINWFIRNMRK